MKKIIIILMALLFIPLVNGMEAEEETIPTCDQEVDGGCGLVLISYWYYAHSSLISWDIDFWIGCYIQGNFNNATLSKLGILYHIKLEHIGDRLSVYSFNNFGTPTKYYFPVSPSMPVDIFILGFYGIWSEG